MHLLKQAVVNLHVLKILTWDEKTFPNFIWEVSYLRRSAVVKKAITQSYCLLVRLYGGDSSSTDLNTGRNDLGIDPCTYISRMTALKHMAVKTIIQIIRSLNTIILNWMKGTRKRTVWCWHCQFGRFGM